MSKLLGICLAVGMVAVVFSQVLFSSQKESKPDSMEVIRILLRHTILENIQSNGNVNRLTKFSWKNCGVATDPLDIKTFTLAPDPVKLPGAVDFSVSGAFLDVLASPIKMNVTMKINAGVVWVTVPCINNIGTCVYSDVCALLATVDCPAEVQKEGFNCTCPFPKKPVDIPISPMNITGGDQIPAGDYDIVADLSRAAGHVGCYQFYVSVTH